MTGTSSDQARQHVTAESVDCTHAVFEFLQELLRSSDSASFPVEYVLPRLAAAFGASRAGLAGFRDDLPFLRQRTQVEEDSSLTQDWPWVGTTDLLAQAQSTATAVAVQRLDQGSLLSAASTVQEGVCWLVWVEASAARTWSAGECAALGLAVAAVARLQNAGIESYHRAHCLEQARLRLRLEDAALIVGRLAHDFNNVLTGIMGFTELGMSQTPTGSTLKQFLTEVYDAAQKGATLTAQLRLFSQRGPSVSYPMSLGDALADFISRQREEWDNDVTLDLDVPDDLPFVAFDAEQVPQVLGHLLNNAREAMPSGGSIHVAARPLRLTEEECLHMLGRASAGLHVEVTIADTGLGLSPDTRRRIFAEPFFSTKPRHRGLGLVVVYGILRAHRGAIRVEPGPNRGTMVRFYLPAATQHATATTALAAEPGADAASGERILVVDDESMVLQLVCTTLLKAGYQALGAADAEEALATYRAAATPFDLVLTDVVMPGMSGFDLARQLLDDDPAVNILFTSGHVPPRLAQEDFASRHFDILSKPFHSNGLLQAVRTALDRPASQR